MCATPEKPLHSFALTLLGIIVLAALPLRGRAQTG